MSLKKLIPLFVVGLLALAAVFGVVAYKTVFAQTPSPTQSSPGTAATPAAPASPAQPNNGKGFGFHHAEFGVTDQDVATALGIDVTKLQAAYQTATADALKQAVSAGVITQSQADQLTARGFVIRGLGGEEWLSANGIDYNALLAKALGISTDQLQAGFKKAYDTAIDQAVANGSLTQQQGDLAKGRYALQNDSKFQSAMKSAFEAAVKQAVTDGVITQSQADQILKNMSGSTGFFGGFGRFGGFGKGGEGFFHGFGGRHGFFGGSPLSPGTPATPAAPTTVPSSGL